MTGWHVLGPLKSVDGYEDCSVPIDEFIAGRTRKRMPAGEVADALVAYRQAAEVDPVMWRHAPRVWFDPFADDIAVLVKQDNDGTIYLVVRDPKPYRQMMTG